MIFFRVVTNCALLISATPHEPDEGSPSPIDRVELRQLVLQEYSIINRIGPLADQDRDVFDGVNDSGSAPPCKMLLMFGSNCVADTELRSGICPEINAAK